MIFAYKMITINIQVKKQCQITTHNILKTVVITSPLGFQVLKEHIKQ